MPIDPLAASNTFLDIINRANAQRAERANLLTQLQARHEEGLAEREQAKLLAEEARKQQGLLFSQSLGLQQQHMDLSKQQFAATQEERMRADEREGWYARVDLRPDAFEMVGGTLQPKGPVGNIVVSPSGVARREVSREEKHKTDLALAREAAQVPNEVRLKFAQDIAAKHGPEAAAYYITNGYKNEINQWDAVNSVAEILYGGDKIAQAKYKDGILRLAYQNATNPAQAVEAQMRLRILDKDLGADEVANIATKINTDLKNSMTSDAWADLTNDAVRYQQAFTEERDKQLVKGTIPTSFSFKGRLTGTPSYILHYFNTNILTHASKNYAPRAPNALETVQKIQEANKPASGGNSVSNQPTKFVPRENF